MQIIQINKVIDAKDLVVRGIGVVLDDSIIQIIVDEDVPTIMMVRDDKILSGKEHFLKVMELLYDMAEVK